MSRRDTILKMLRRAGFKLFPRSLSGRNPHAHHWKAKRGKR